MNPGGESEYAPDGKYPPFVVFDIERQDNVAGGFRFRWQASLWLWWNREKNSDAIA
jgi:hypothetical protein